MAQRCHNFDNEADNFLISIIYSLVKLFTSGKAVFVYFKIIKVFSTVSSCFALLCLIDSCEQNRTYAAMVR